MFRLIGQIIFSAFFLFGRTTSDYIDNDLCEVIFGPCDCESGRIRCCNPGQCSTTTTKVAINSFSLDPWLLPKTYLPRTTRKTTTRETRPCPPGALSDGYRGCYYADTCEMFYGRCDCERGRTTCCTPGQCVETTVPPNKNKCHKK